MRLAGTRVQTKVRETPDTGWLSLLDAELLRVAAHNNLPTMLVQIAASGGLVLLARGHEVGWYEAWFAVILGVCAARLWVDRSLNRHFAGTRPIPGPHLRTWARAHGLGLVVSGGLWAFLAWFRLPVEDDTTRFAIIIIVSALAGGAMGVLAPMLTTGRIYITLILVPACGRLLFDGVFHPVLGGAGLAFWLVMLAGHRNNHGLLLRSIELGAENKALVEELKARNAEVAQANETLEERVAERTQTLEALTVQAEAANRAKSEFLATISHEVRTPLNGVLGMTQVMQLGDLEPLQRERLDVIGASARALLAIVNDVLDISKIEAGKMELNSAAFHMDALGEGIRRLYEPLAAEKGLEFSLDMSGLAAGPRHGDEGRLRQIVSNLVSNALKFTERGGIRVEISGDAAQIACTVHDTGIGIAPDQQGSIFEKFLQIDGSNTRRVGGTGLGLAICRELAEMMGGEVSFVSAPGAGSSFTLTLPIALTGDLPDTAPAPDQTVAGAPRILVVDDNPTNRLVLQTLLAQLGLTCGEAQDGLEAISAWDAEEWDAILMDINMPNMDGMEATRAIRAREKDLHRRHTPIIAVTASILSHETRGYCEVGMDDVVAKPVDARRLVESLNRQISAAA